MNPLIDRSGLRADSWVRIAEDGEAPAGADCLLSLAQWQANPERWSAHDGRIGIELAPDEDPAELLGLFDSLALIAVQFPKFTDGRGYSSARLLRDAHGWRGELRATGDVLHDQLFLMARCGFDSFALRADQSTAAALAAFATFSAAYQPAADEVTTVMQRRYAKSAP